MARKFEQSIIGLLTNHLAGVMKSERDKLAANPKKYDHEESENWQMNEPIPTLVY